MTDVIIEQLKQFLTGHMAHKNFEDAISDFPMSKINTKLDNIPYTFWHLLEHIRRGQKDIYEYISSSDYKSMNWPDDYWPPRNKEATAEDWNKTINEIRDLYEQSKALIENKSLAELSKKIEFVDKDHSVLRGIILIIDHNAFHMGQFVTMRMVLGSPSVNKNSPV